jgi:hypothetical protein
MGSACNLQILVDGSNDSDKLSEGEWKGLVWRTSVCYDPDMKVGTWHWPERE